ncbi:MAG TPA: transposase [Candidatus Dormibacteraeota bacterium]|nr:transposase [Candidatus Dormibacteraeota bacterium]
MGESFGDPEGIGILDETGFLEDPIERRLDGEPLKEGSGLGGGRAAALRHGQSGRGLPGGPHQNPYRGTPSELVPIGIPRWGPLADATSREQALLDRRRYLPEAWCNDPVRRARAKVPEEVSFPTKPELAIARLEPAWAQGERGRDR